MYIIGKTGMGKTNLLEHLAIQDIRNGHGIAYIDPHGDTAENLLKAIPSHRINDVIYFNAADQEYPIAFNIMHDTNVSTRHLTVSGLVGVFKKIWSDSWGPRLEYILRNTILTLIEMPRSTLVDVMQLLINDSYRSHVIANVNDPIVNSFWTKEYMEYSEKLRNEAIAPIQNKVGQFLSSPLMRNIIGQTKSSFDIRKIMDSRQILIVNLSKGKIGEDNSALLGAMILTKIQLAAMSRADIPEHERNDFYLYVDEFQNFATEAFANILSEARKYHLSIILANQYIEQIDENIRYAIFGNCGTLISFRVGARDAAILKEELGPPFEIENYCNLQKYHIYIELMIDGIAGNAFSATTLPPISLQDTENNIDKILRVSRSRYSTKKEIVEMNISRRYK